MYASKHVKHVPIVQDYKTTFRCPECGKRDFPMLLNPETGGESCASCLPSNTTFHCAICDTSHTLGVGPLFGNGWHPDESSLEIMHQVSDFPRGKTLWAEWETYCKSLGQDPSEWDTPEEWDWEKASDFSQMLYEYSQDAIRILEDHTSPECWVGWSQGDFGHYARPAEYCEDHVEW